MHVPIIDRQDFIKALKDKLVVDPQKTAVVAIDMHRGHLDPEVATLPVSVEIAKSVIDNTVELLNFSRFHGIPVIHVVLTLRDIPGLGAENMFNPFWKAVQETNISLTVGVKGNVGAHNVQGSVQCAIIPELYDPAKDWVIDNKKRFSAFYGTDLEILLRTLGVDTLVLIGINTNTCVQCSTFEATNRDFKSIVITECVNSSYGEDLHILGLQNIQRCLGWVLTVEEFKTKVNSFKNIG